MKKPLNKKKKNWSLIIQLVIGSIVGLIIGIYGVNKVFTEEWKSSTLLLSVLFMFISIFININIHEFGHFIFGKIFGYRLLSYRIGFLTWNYENGRMKFSIIKNKGYDGLCAMIPPKHEISNSKIILFSAGGIMLNILSGLVFLSLPSVLLNPPFTLKLFLYISGGTALFLAILNLLPFFSGNNPTDGKVIWSLFLKRPFAKKLIELNKTIAQLSAGTRPRDMEISSEVNMDSQEIYDLMTKLHLYFKALDNKDFDNALNCINFLEDNLEAFPYVALPGLYYELCFMGCITGDKNRTKIYYNKAGKVLQNDKDINGMRVKAYYEYYINNNEASALKFCDSAIEVESKFPIKGQSLMERDLVEALKEYIALNPGAMGMEQGDSNNDALLEKDALKVNNKTKSRWKIALAYIFIVFLFIISMQFGNRFTADSGTQDVYELYYEGRYQDALDGINEEIKNEPGEYSYYNLKGRILLQMDRDQEALDSFDKAFELNPKDTESLYEKSSYYYYNEDYKKSLENAEKALKIAPEDGYALMNKAFAMQGMELYEESIVFFDKAYEYSEDIECLLGKGMSLHYTNQNGEAIKVFEEYNEVYDENSQVHYFMAEAHLYLGNNDKAIEYYKNALKFDNEYSDAYYGISRIYALTGNDKLAIENLKNAFKYDTKGELRNQAETDSAFDKIKLTEEFKKATK